MGEINVKLQGTKDEQINVLLRSKTLDVGSPQWRQEMVQQFQAALWAFAKGEAASTAHNEYVEENFS